MQKFTLEEIQQRAIGQRFELALPLERAEGESTSDSRTVNLAVTSDQPILHWFGYLKLNHSPKAIRMERVKAGAPLLLEHNRECKIGGLSNWQSDGHKLRADATFSRRPEAQAELDDLQDGIPRQVSGGFLLHHVVLVEEKDDDYNLYQSDDWEPIEASLVSIPADISVGIGRALEASIDPPTTRAPGEPTPRIASITERTTQPMDKDLELIAIGERFGELELAQSFALQGKSVEELRAAILGKRTTKQTPTPAPPVQLTEKEEKEFSLVRGIQTLLNGGKSFELEVSQQIQRTLGVQGRGGFFMPTNLRQSSPAGAVPLQRAGLEVKTASAGGRAVFTEYGGFIDLLRNQAMVAQLGATFLPGLVGNVSFVRQATAGAAYWVTENSGSDVTQTDATIELVTLAPKNLMALTSYSRQLLAQSSFDINTFVMNDLAKVNALAIDLAALHGASNGLTGIYAESGVNAVAFGGSTSSSVTTGGVPTFAKMVEMETAVAASNADTGSMAYLTTPNMRGLLKTTLEFASVGFKPIWTGGKDMGEVNGYRAEVSNNVSKTMTASAITGGTAHGIIFGAWENVMIGEWGAMEVTVDPYTLAAQGMVRVITYLLCDEKLKYGPAFAKGTMATLT